MARKDCTNCGKDVEVKNAIVCNKCLVEYRDVFPTGWSNQRSFTMRFPIRSIAILLNFIALMIGVFWVLGFNLPFVGQIPEIIGLTLLISGGVGFFSCMVCYS